jgi:hypothetical protein
MSEDDLPLDWLQEAREEERILREVFGERGNYGEDI